MSDSVPEWLDPLTAAIADLRSDDLSPLLPPPPADARPAAVLMVFSGLADDGSILLTERAATLRSHAGQISFPGGATDPTDADAIAAALREADEEIGLPSKAVDVIGTLPELWLPPSNFAVTPVLSYQHEPVDMWVRNPHEVAAVLPTSIDRLLDPANRFTVVHPMGWKGPAFDIGIETPLWGFTAGILSRLFAIAGWERAWDESRTRPVPA